MRDRSWVKSRITARILLRNSSGHVTARDRRLALMFADDPAVTDRLVEQAIASICAEKRLPLAQNYAVIRNSMAP